MSRKRLVLVVALVGVALLVGGIAQFPAEGAGKRVKILMSAVEYKGGANIADEAYPPAAEPGTLALAPLGGGYRLKDPDPSGRWEVSSYRFEPGLLVVERGSRVKIEIAGINGARHDSFLVSPSGETKRTFVVTRGRLTRFSFRASQTGLWRMVCETHPPGMVTYIQVV